MKNIIHAFKIKYWWDALGVSVCKLWENFNFNIFNLNIL